MTLPDALSRLRLVLAPALWALALLGQDLALGVGIAVAGTTDVLDGAIARHRGQASKAGSRLDTAADLLILTSIPIWFALLRTEFVTRHILLLASCALAVAGAMSIGWFRFRRIGDLHLYSTKAAAAAVQLFAIWLLVFGSYSVGLLYVAAAVVLVAALEAGIVLATRDSVDEQIGSILKRP